MEDTSGRGGGWVVGQMVLLAAVLLAPKRLPGVPDWPAGARRVGRVGGLASLGAAAVLLALGGRALGQNLTPFPRPKADGTLVQTGVYGAVRHPLYTALTLGALGVALLRGSSPALFLSAVLALFFDRKAAVEERWLAQRFPEYAAYRRRVAKLVPFVY